MDNFHTEFYPNLMENAENTGKIPFTLLLNYDSHFTDCHETAYIINKIMRRSSTWDFTQIIQEVWRTRKKVSLLSEVRFLLRRFSVKNAKDLVKMIFNASYTFPDRDTIFFENTDTSLTVRFYNTETVICEKERENYTAKSATLC
jgi:hypothetical protein